MELRYAVKYFALENAIQHQGQADKKSVVGKTLAFDPEAKKDIKKTMQIVEKAVSNINKMSLEEQKIEFSKMDKIAVKKEKKEKQLPAVGKKFVVRFAPNPDGVLHIGSARPAILNYYYAEKYKGKFILRFDDTDAKLKIPEKWFYNQIEKDLQWLGVKYDEKYYASKRVKIYLKYAEKLLKMGKAYVCLCQDKWKQFRDQGKPCPCRELAKEEQLERWENMKKHNYKEGQAVLRIKTDLKSKNKETIDWPAFRIIDQPQHPLSQQHLWPLYNFASAIDDHILGITHIMRGQEHKTNELKQKFVYDFFGWTYPVNIILGRFMLKDTELSKSKIREGINSGKYTGWDDPRIGTIMALKKRGFQPEAVNKLIVDIGIKSSDVKVSMDNLAAYNRKILDPVAKRLFFVSYPVEISVPVAKNQIKIPYHPENKKQKRTIALSEKILVAKDDFEYFKGKEVRLKDWCNIILSKKPEPTGKENKPIPKIQWVPKGFSKKALLLKPEKKVEGFIEKNIDNFKPGSTIQLERVGFVRIDTKKPLTLYFAHR